MKEMKKYYTKVGEVHHRFCAINDYAAQIIAGERAACKNEIVHKAEIYDTIKHGTHFKWEQICPNNNRNIREQTPSGSLITGLV